MHRSDDKKDGEENPYIKHSAAEDMDVSSIGDRKNENEDILAEDKFHLNLPKNVDQYTGLKMDVCNLISSFMYVCFSASIINQSNMYAHMYVCMYYCIYLLIN